MNYLIHYPTSSLCFQNPLVELWVISEFAVAVEKLEVWREVVQLDD